MQTWKKYIWIQLLQAFFGTLIGFYALYVLIDFSNQLGAFRSKGIHISWLQWGVYYALEFVHRADVLIPFALSLATMRVLLRLNTNNELTALQCGGLSLRTLMRPFLILGILCTLFLYANEQWFIPRSLAQVKFLHAIRKQKPAKNLQVVPHTLPLGNNAFFVYQNYEPDQLRFFDAYWIKNIHEIYKIKYFYPYAQIPYGEFVESFKRDEKGKLNVTSSDSFLALTDLKISNDSLKTASAIPELQPLSELWSEIKSPGTMLTPREAQISTVFFHKASMPLLCLIAVLIPASFCTRFARQLPIFLYYAIGIFSLIAFYLFLDALTVISRRQLADPAFLLLTPIGLTMLFGLYRFYKMR
ncbi:MAG: LptF/LptG family permease [Parachlamydiales bacterium]|jgi:lipopolysaccharide export system permease protein